MGRCAIEKKFKRVIFSVCGQFFAKNWRFFGKIKTVVDMEILSKQKKFLHYIKM